MKTIYYKNKSDKAKVVFEKYIIDDLDADDALRRFPDDYSIDGPNDPKAMIVDKSAPSVVDFEKMGSDTPAATGQ